MPKLEFRSLCLVVALCSAASAAEPPLHRHRAPIQIEQNAAFVRLALTPELYALNAQRSLADLLLQDARGERVPFAVLPADAEETQTKDQWRDAALYRLPPRPASGAWTAPVEVVVNGGQIAVRQRGAVAPSSASPGWLFDLGERRKEQPAPTRLQLQWSGPAEFNSGYTLEHSADLKAWRDAPGGQLMALTSSGVALTQPDVPLPPDVQRFVRLVWAGGTPAPQLAGARTATPDVRTVAREVLHALSVAATDEAAGPHRGTQAERTLHFDLGAVLPLVQVDLQMPEGNRVLPVQLQVRARSDAPWEAAAGTVFYRISREGAAVQSPPLALRREARYIRLVVDERSARPAAETVKLLAQVQLGSLVFATQGQPPYSLHAGASKPAPGALPLATVVPELQQERPRFGRATLGAWSEVGAAVAHAQSEARQQLWRPAALWAVLLAGVAGLALMVWRLAKGRPS
jgi:Protein of unknown function (DUF3999)